MLKLNSGTVGIAQGDAVLFSDFEDDGPMWRGVGQRESRSKVSFAQAYRTVPHVQVSVSMLDMSNISNIRLDVQAENITETGFDIVFRTWADSQVARVRVAWMSIGELPDEDNWDL
ncbi:H-type lectin domain-containing protein [Yoonia sp.]|uniref:H-type lectin domain-containing protein n=1 Tax=Yoonia sp. TaxID=2212373 RepID=UPI003F6D9708